ncbi:MAG: hypothetical protein WCE79_23235 [Xanthobacteraceae bacterium]
MALTFNLAAIPLKYVAFPVVVGLAAGTGALAAYVTAGSAPAATKEPAAIIAALPATSTAPGPAVVTTEQITPARPAKKLSCEEQTWPYIDNRCIARKGDKGAEPTRAVRFVMAPRDEGGITSGNGPKLITSDGVLRGPGVAPEADAPKARPVTPTVKKAAKRADRRQARDDVRGVYSVYSVPSAGGTKPVIVVRPPTVEQYSSRF